MRFAGGNGGVWAELNAKHGLRLTGKDTAEDMRQMHMRLMEYKRLGQEAAAYDLKLTAGMDDASYLMLSDAGKFARWERDMKQFDFTRGQTEDNPEGNGREKKFLAVSEEWARSTAKFTVAWENLRKSIAINVLPILGKFVGWLAEAINWLSRSKELGAVLGTVITAFAAFRAVRLVQLIHSLATSLHLLDFSALWGGLMKWFPGLAKVGPTVAKAFHSLGITLGGSALAAFAAFAAAIAAVTFAVISFRKSFDGWSWREFVDGVKAAVRNALPKWLRGADTGNEVAASDRSTHTFNDVFYGMSLTDEERNRIKDDNWNFTHELEKAKASGDVERLKRAMFLVSKVSEGNIKLKKGDDWTVEEQQKFWSNQATLFERYAANMQTAGRAIGAINAASSNFSSVQTAAANPAVLGGTTNNSDNRTVNVSMTFNGTTQAEDVRAAGRDAASTIARAAGAGVAPRYNVKFLSPSMAETGVP